MGRIEKTVFISYRRANFPWALAIYQNLTHHGYDAFFDYQSIDSGGFEKVILENIKSRAHFILVLTPSALERCKNPGDWLRREIETAIDEKRNIVPLMMDGFDFGTPFVKEALTGKLTVLSGINALPVPEAYAVEAMNRLRERFLNVSLSDVVLPTLPEELQARTATEKAAANEAPAVKEEQLTAQTWFERGYMYAMIVKNFDEAIRCCSEAIRIQPDFPEAYGARAYAIIEKGGELQDALSDINIAIRLKPDDDVAYNNRGRIYYLQGKKDKALDDFSLAIKYNPYNDNSYYNRGLHWIEKGDIGRAIKDFNEAVRIKSDFIEALYARANAHKDNGNFEKAILDYTQAIYLKPDMDEAYNGRGITFALQNNNLKALSDFQKASELQPEKGSYRASLSRVLEALGHTQEAEEQKRKAGSLIHKEDEYERAFFASICGNTDQALTLLEIALEKKQVTKEWAWEDPDLQWIRDDPRFVEIVGPKPE